jgi:hypothetical protein
MRDRTMGYGGDSSALERTTRGNHDWRVDLCTHRNTYVANIGSDAGTGNLMERP